MYGVNNGYGYSGFQQYPQYPQQQPNQIQNQIQTNRLQTPVQNVNWIPVNGIDGAKNHIVQPSCTAWLMDNNEPKFYVKSADNLGVTTLKAYQFNEIPTDMKVAENINVDYSMFATKEDVEKIKHDLDLAIENKINSLAKQEMMEV